MKFTKAIASLGAGVMLLTVATTAPASAAAKTSVEPTGLTGIQQVSHTGRWVIGDGVRLDRATGERAPSWASTPTGSSTTQFVRDNPNLALERESMVDVVDADGDTVGYRSGPVWLTNAATGSRVRIDTDSTGAPLEPSWTPYEIDEPSLNDTPSIVVSPDSVTRDGTLVAFCSDFQVPNQFTLYLKDTRTGALTKRAEECGSGGPDPGGEYVRVDPPEVSFDGKVVHLRGRGVRRRARG